MSFVRSIAIPTLHSSGMGCTPGVVRFAVRNWPSWTRQLVGRRCGKSPGRQVVNCF